MKKWFAGVALVLCLPVLAQGEWVAGEVVKVDPERGRITLKHAPIGSVKMAAMTMRFRVADRGLLGAHKAGDRVRFAVVVHEDELLVTRLESAP